MYEEKENDSSKFWLLNLLSTIDLKKKLISELNIYIETFYRLLLEIPIDNQQLRRLRQTLSLISQHVR
jgi:hypothetical protein